MEAKRIEDVDFLSHKAGEVILRDSVVMICGEVEVICSRLLKIDSWNPDVIQLEMAIDEVRYMDCFEASKTKFFFQWDIADYHCPRWAIEEYFFSEDKDKTKAAEAINKAHIERVDRETRIMLRQIYTVLFGDMNESCDGYVAFEPKVEKK